MKKVLTESSEVRREAEAEKREQINHTFRTAPFAELVKRTQPKVIIIPKLRVYCSIRTFLEQ